MHYSTLLASALAMGVLARPYNNKLEDRELHLEERDIDNAVVVPRQGNGFGFPDFFPRPGRPRTTPVKVPVATPRVPLPILRTPTPLSLAPKPTVKAPIASLPVKPSVPAVTPVLPPIPTALPATSKALPLAAVSSPPAVPLQPSSVVSMLVGSPIMASSPVTLVATPLAAASSSLAVPVAASQQLSPTPSVAVASNPSLSVLAVAQTNTQASSRVTGANQALLSSGAQYQASVLYHHNKARANHNAAPLTWSTDCEANARIAAQTCNFAHYLPTGVKQGQNLYTTSGQYFNVTAGITESWYKKEFPPMMPYYGQADIPTTVFPSVGHLTQLLWKGTTQVGCVSIDCGSKMVVGGQYSNMNKYTVCNYSPAGNIRTRYALNVGSPISTTNLGRWTD